MDEEALAGHLSPREKKVRGAYFTPSTVVERVLDAVAAHVPARAKLRIVDPACGAGAFLLAAARRWPKAECWGFELNAQSAQHCRERIPTANVQVADALRLNLPHRDDTFELWVGNPPYNGTSPLLQDKEAWEAVCRWLPPGVTLQKRHSLREDFVFFLLKASMRLQEGPGALAFITSATLLDAFAYAPVRQALLSRLTLHEVFELPPKIFAGTRVKTCVTVWSTCKQLSLVRHGTDTFSPRPPEWVLRPLQEDAEALHARWSAEGEPLTSLIPISFAGLKTRFDELLVDDDRNRLEERVAAFLSTRKVDIFAERYGLSGFATKLEALKQHAGQAIFDDRNVRPFIRYRGPNPRGTTAWCYVDRHLIPRGDHRLRGAFDPHAEPLKLVFNLHELPLWATVLDEPGCVTMYRHARFAPAYVPRALLTEPHATTFDADDIVPNLSERGQALGSVREVFEHVVKQLTSDAFQRVWAPNFGTTRVPPIALTKR